MSLSPVYWRTTEEEAFRTYYPLMGSRVSKLLPNRTPAAIRRRAIRSSLATDKSLVYSRCNQERQQRWREQNPALQVFESRLMPVTESGCWIWMGPVTAKGHGVFCYGGKRMSAGRWANEHFLGISEGWAWRSCGEPSCVNPWHMRRACG